MDIKLGSKIYRVDFSKIGLLSLVVFGSPLVNVWTNTPKSQDFSSYLVSVIYGTGVTTWLVLAFFLFVIISVGISSKQK